MRYSPILKVIFIREFYELSKHPIYDNQNSIIGIIGQFVDITEHKIAEEHRVILDLSINAMKEGVCVYIISTGKYLYLNKSCREIYGISDRDYDSNKSIMNNELSKYIHPDDKYEQEHHIRLGKWPRKNVFRILKNNNEIRWIETRHTTINYSGEECIAFFCRDITDEIRNKEFYKLLKDTLDIISDGVMIIDQNSLECIYINKVIEKLTGYKTEELCSKSSQCLYDIVHPDDLYLIFKDGCVNNLLSDKIRIVKKDNSSINFSIKLIAKKFKNTDYVILILSRV